MSFFQDEEVKNEDNTTIESDENETIEDAWNKRIDGMSKEELYELRSRFENLSDDEITGEGKEQKYSYKWDKRYRETNVDDENEEPESYTKVLRRRM